MQVGIDLVSMLLLTQDTQCADARDRVFALLGMLEPYNRLEIKPDYTKTVADVFKQVVLQLLFVLNRLNVLSHCRFDVLSHCKLVPEIVGMPTWVPNWSKRPTYWVSKTRASLSTNAVAEYDSESALRVLAVEVGTIASLQNLGYLAKNGSDVRSWADFVSRTFSLLSASEMAAGLSSSIEVIMRTLCLNRFTDICEPPQLDLLSSSDVKESLLRWREYLASETLRPDSCEPPPIPSESLVF